MLSSQNHYDWGLRSLKTILKGCGDSISLKRLNNDAISNDEEAKILLHTIQLNTLSKLTFKDSQIFQEILNDFFPNIDKSIIYVSYKKFSLKMVLIVFL